MKQFEVYSHPALGLQAVKNGFSWPGFFFTWLWMLICRMWVGGIVVLAILLAIGWVVMPLVDSIVFAWYEAEDGSISAVDAESAIVVSGTIYFALWLAIDVIVGVKGNTWRRSVLSKRGFTHVRSVQARSADTALGQISAGLKAGDEKSP